MSEGEGDQQQKIVECYKCGMGASEATYDQWEGFVRLYRWKSIQTNEFEYICSECALSADIDRDRVAWIDDNKTSYLSFGQVVLSQVDNKERENEDGWFRATVWKADDEKKECEIEFHDKSKGILTKKYDDIKTLETFYNDYEDDVSEVPLMHYYDNYADYARRHDILPEFDFVQIEDNQISEELKQSLNQNLEDILITKKVLKTDVENSLTNNTVDYFQKNKNASDNFEDTKKSTEQNATVEKFEKEQKIILINPQEFCFVRGETVLKEGVEDEYYTYYTQKNPLKRFKPLNYHFFDTRMQLSKYQRIATNFFMDKNNQVIIEDYISGLTPRKNHTKLYDDIGKIYSNFVPLFEKCLQNIYEKYRIFYSKELRDLCWPEPPEKRQKLMMEQSFLTGRKMQVFVKAVDYKILPGKKFQGEWKVEGLQQENIVAVGIYCCEISEDLLDFGLEFRRGINDSEISALQESLYAYLPIPFDTDNAEIILGSVPIRKNVCIAFPNDVQHRITKFQQKIYFNKKNQENVKNCKILYFFLIDPELEIVSSADIQNQNWEENKILILMELQKIAKRILGQSFSQEVVQKILLGAKTGVCAEVELIHRRAAMQSAKQYNDGIKDIFTRSFRREIFDF